MVFNLLPDKLRGPAARWKRAHAATVEKGASPLAAYYDAGLPDKRATIEDASILALDFETSGLDPNSDEILSMGWVVIEQGRVNLGDSHHEIVCPEKALKAETVPIHGLSHDMVAQAPPLDVVLPILLNELRGRVLLAHHAKIEMGFLDAACQRLYGVPFVAFQVDTLLLERRFHQRSGQIVQAGGYRLDEVRKRYNLPRYKAHNACTDALAAAELFLAQISFMGGCKKVHISEVMI